MTDRTDWHLKPALFQKIDQSGMFEVNLFASGVTTQCPVNYSWQSDPCAVTIDAFLQDCPINANSSTSRVGPISGKDIETKNFQRRLPPYCTSQDLKPTNHMTHFHKRQLVCCRRYSYPFSGPLLEVVNILAYLFTDGCGYNSLNSYRSAISSAHDQTEGYSVGQHPLVTRLLKCAGSIRLYTVSMRK